MGKVAVIFPGQGSQTVGMGKDFYDKFDTAKKLFQKADDTLGFSLSKLIFEGPEEELKLTEHTQPAILLISLVIWQIMLEQIPVSAHYFAGHSLGEYTALAAAGSISFDDAIALVRRRGQFMEKAVPNGEGAMAAIMGMEREDLEKICAEVSAEGTSVQLANINASNQIVISGTAAGVIKTGNLAKEKGARRVIPLPVSGPFHSRLMEPAKKQLEPLVHSINAVTAKTPVIMNVTAKPETSPSKIKINMINQVVSPVLWTDSVELMIDNGIDTFIEVGPGNVLSGLVKKINGKVKAYSVNSIIALNELHDLLSIKGGKNNA